jgi:hypothetical protein
MRSRLILAVLLFSTLSQAMAGEKILATILRTTDSVKSEIVINTDDKSDISFVIFKIYDEEGVLDREVNVTPEELPDGKTVLSKLGVDIIELQSDNVASHNGGEVNIRFLSRFKLIGKSKYGSFKVLLDREGDEWLLKKDGESFTQLLAHAHKKGINKFTIIK